VGNQRLAKSESRPNQMDCAEVKVGDPLPDSGAPGWCSRSEGGLRDQRSSDRRSPHPPPRPNPPHAGRPTQRDPHASVSGADLQETARNAAPICPGLRRSRGRRAGPDLGSRPFGAGGVIGRGGSKLKTTPRRGAKLAIFSPRSVRFDIPTTPVSRSAIWTSSIIRLQPSQQASVRIRSRYRSVW